MDFLTFGPRDPTKPWSTDLCCHHGFDFKNDAARKAHVSRYHPAAQRFEVRDTATDTHGPERVYVKINGKWALEGTYGKVNGKWVKLL